MLEDAPDQRLGAPHNANDHTPDGGERMQRADTHAETPTHGRPVGDQPATEKHGEPAGGRTAPAPGAASPPVAKKRGAKRFILPLILLAVLGGGGWYGYYYATEGRFLESTDDAYVGADMSIVSPKIGGYVTDVPVQENQVVKAGQPLIVIDQGDYKLAVAAAEAKIATQQATLASSDAQHAAAQASVGEAEANVEAVKAELAQADLDLNRARDLASRGAGAKAVQDSAQSARNTANAKLAGANASLAAAKANLAVIDSQKIEAQRVLDELAVARDQAKRELSFTTLTAPYDGIVGNLSAHRGDLVATGRQLAAVVPLHGIYIDGNFKETQLADIVPGQKAHIEIDALPGRALTGTVVSLSPASGSVFSLLPSDNATGNFTKVTQRVPVRVAIDDADDLAGKLRPGLSAVVSIDLRTTPEHARSVTGAPAAEAATDAARP